MRYYEIFLYADSKQDYIMLFIPFENKLSHGVNGRMKNGVVRSFC